MAGLIDTLTRLSSPGAYVGVGLLATAEAVFVGLVLPGELALLLGGFLAYQGRVSLAGMVAVAAVATAPSSASWPAGSAPRGHWDCR